MLTLGVGVFNVAGEDDATGKDHSSGQLELQFRPDWKLWWIQPMVGGFVTWDGDVFGYLGISIDIPIGDHIIARPSFAPGLYGRGNGVDLGGTVQFRTGIELAWKFENGMRLGAEFYHLSNAGIYDENPGTESALLTFTLPLRW